MKRTLFAGILCLVSLAAGAINRVTMLETPKHGELKLIESGKLRFAIVADRNGEDDFVGPDGLKLRQDQKSDAPMMSEEKGDEIDLEL